MGRIPISRIFFVIFYLFGTFGEGWCCEQNWLQYDDQCFLIIPVRRTKALSRLLCIMEGSDLVSITDTDTLDYLEQHIADVVDDEPFPFWVGLRRNPKDGQLQWVNNAKADQMWVEDEEIHIHDNDSLEHFYECFALGGRSVRRAPCQERYGFICGHARGNESTPNVCLFGIEAKESFVGAATGNCLFRAAEEARWDKAEETCRDYGAEFLDLHGVLVDGMSAFYDHKILTNDGSHYWTGLTWNGTDILWSSGNPLEKDFATLFVNGSGSCITVQFNFTDVLETHLFQTECSNLAGVLCSRSSETVSLPTPSSSEKPRSDVVSNLKCPGRLDTILGGSWKPLGDHCYWETSYETKHLTWYDAESFCQAFEGGHLASFHSLDEEKTGLSFQHGKLPHPYWIGLSLDVETETYRWSDGTPLNYTNWAPGHPNHRDRRLRCVAMNGKETHWVSSLCGIHSWFVCKVPKRSSWPEPVMPSFPPPEPCDVETTESETETFSFQGSCYFEIKNLVSWHRAKLFCENEGSSLVSVHSDQEMEFLLRVLNGGSGDTSRDNTRVWIGLNTLSSDGSLRWTDWTPVDYTYWNEGEPNNHMYQEKCTNMIVSSGLWNDENCNAPMGFICKRRNVTSATTVLPISTPDPRVGNCKKGWIAHHDRCYYVGGYRPRDRVNWTEASEMCIVWGGYLTSIRDDKDQTFLTYLLQSLGVSAWIGLHDTIQTRRYYWVDNSEVQYTRWAYGEPSLLALSEDCVKMEYDTGLWRDDVCENKMGYICHSRKDPSLPEPTYDRGINCLNHDGWLKLGSMCYKMFGSSLLTWSEAESVCQKDGGHLVSIFDQSVKAVVSYLATEVNNSSFWIGLQYKESDRRLRWLNGWPMDVTFWGRNEPSNLTEGTCFASNIEGYWMKVPCEEVLPFLCQITTGFSPKRKLYTGSCDGPSKFWTSVPGSFCYSADNASRLDFYDAMTACLREGSHLVSIHSTEELDGLKKLMKRGIQSVFIGMVKSHTGGFMWTDSTAVDFVNWDAYEPSSSTRLHCVEMMADTLKWRLTACDKKKHFLCKENKDTLYYEDPRSEKWTGGPENELSGSAVTWIVIFCVIAITVMVAAAALYYKKYSRNRPRGSFRHESVSFENALYNVNSASMDLNEHRS